MSKVNSIFEIKTLVNNNGYSFRLYKDNNTFKLSSLKVSTANSKHERDSLITFKHERELIEMLAQIDLLADIKSKFSDIWNFNIYPYNGDLYISYDDIRCDKTISSLKDYMSNFNHYVTYGQGLVKFRSRKLSNVSKVIISTIDTLTIHPPNLSNIYHNI